MGRLGIEAHTSTRILVGLLVTVPSELIKDLSALNVNDGLACMLLPSSNSGIDIERVNLHGESAPSRHFGSDDRCAASSEAVQDNAVPLGTILDGISHHGDGFDGWMHLQVCQPSWSQRVDAVVVPHVGSVPT